MKDIIDINKEYTYADGSIARIICTDYRDENFPVISVTHDGRAISHTIDGYCYQYTKIGFAKYNLIPKLKYGHLKKDDKVIVWDDCKPNNKAHRYFSHEANGYAYCFSYGATSWSNDNINTTPTFWENCVKADE